jgi:hypothetical protein
MFHFFSGESKGQTGIFPASFVRIIDSFPGPVPPVTADLSMYLKASSNNPGRGNNDYMNTRYILAFLFYFIGTLAGFDLTTH